MPPVPPPPYVDPYGMIGTTAAAGGSNEQLDVLRKSIDRAAAVTASKLVSGDRQQNPVDLAVKMAMKTSGIGLQQQNQQQQQQQYNITSSIYQPQQQLPQQPI
jgi:hydrogenase maturation factor